MLQTDSVSILVSIATYDSKNFGQRIVTLSGLSLIEQDEDSKNYVLETQIFDLDGFINKKQITVSGIGEITKVYDGTTDVEVLNVGVNYEFEGLKGNDELSLFDYVAQFDSINAGDRTINVSELTIDNENYELTTESFVISATITVRYLEIEWQDTDLEFTNELQLPTAIIKNLSFVLEQDLSLVNSLIVSLKSGTDGKSVGEHYAIVAFANEVLNYELTNVETLYSIGMIQLEVHWENYDLTYNGANQKPVAYVWVSQGVRENLLVTVSQTEHKNAGTYQASARSQNENYSVSNATFNFEISKALVDVNEQEIVLQKTYDGTNALPVGFEIVNETHYSLAGLVQGDVVTLSFGVGQFNSVNVGQTTITLTKIEIDNSNYYVDIESLTYNAIINKLGVSIRSTSETVEKVYDKQLDAFTYINSRHYEILGSVLGKVVTLTNFNATFNGVNAGQTTILVTALEIDDDNYYLLDDEFTVNATITRKAITVVWDNLSLPWTGSVQLPTAILNQSDVLQGDEELLQLSAVSLLSGYNGIDVGLHMAVVTITGDASLNYELQNGEQQFSIGQVTVSVQWEGDSFIYNSQEQLPKAFVIINGQRINLLVQSQTLGGAIFVGNHTAVAVNESDDFVIENETKQFVITKKEITVSIENLVVEKVYDATMSVVKDTINITKQNIVFVGVYGNDVVNLDFDEVRFVDSNVGSGKEVVFGSLEIDNNNYELVTQNISTFNNIITPKKITVVKSDNSQKFVKEYDGTVLVAGELQNSDYHFVGVELTDEMSIYLNSNLTKRYASKNSSDSIDVIFENLSINNENYMLTTTELILDGEITPIKVILEWNFTSVEFTGMINKPEPKIVNGNYLVEGDQPLDIIVVLISGDATNVGTHKVEARVDEDVVNYVLIGHEHTFVITNGEFYVEWEQDTLKFIYNGLKQVPTAFVMVAGVREGLIVETLLQSDGTNAGTYTAIARSENDNYQLINDSVVYEIEKIVVQLQMLNNQITKEYDGNVNYSHSLQPNVNYVLVGVLQQDENMVSINHNAIRFSTINVVQNDRIVVTNVVLTNAVNYVLDTQTIELIGSITPKQISISGVGVITKTYDGTVNDSTRLVKGINYMLSGDLVTDNVSLTSYNISFDTINAGSFKTVMVNSLILSNSNYVLQSDWFTLSGEITKKQITLIWSNLNLYFTGQMQIPVAQFNINDIVSFDRQTFEVVVDGQQFEVGSYVATARIVSHENYELTNASQSFEILSAMLEVVWQNVEFTYNGQLNVPSALVTINGVERTLQVAGEQINAGTYVATIIDEFNGNYTYSENEKEFVIKSKQISIVWGQTVLTYNGVEQFPQVSVETGVGNETLELVTYEFGGKTSKNVDKYMAHAVMLTENLNYKLVNDFVEFEIVAKQISIDIAGVVVKEYDRTEKATLTQQNFMFNLQEIYENDSVLVSSYIALFDGADAGVKDIVVTGIKISNANYVINNDTFTISGEITPKLVFIRLENNVSKLQGKSEKQIPFIAIGLVEGDQLIGSLSREEGEEVGAYRIVSGTLTNEFNPNYIFNYNGLTEFSYIIEEDTTWIIYAAVIAGVVVLTTIVSVVVITKRRRNRITEMLNREQLKSIFNNINIGRIRDLENRNNRNYDDDFDTRKK